MRKETPKIVQATPAIEVPVSQNMTHGLDMTSPAYWLRCPFCGGDVVLGTPRDMVPGKDVSMRHSAPQCETYAADVRMFYHRAKQQGARWSRVTPLRVDGLPTK